MATLITQFEPMGYAEGDIHMNMEQLIAASLRSNLSALSFYCCFLCSGALEIAPKMRNLTTTSMLQGYNIFFFLYYITPFHNISHFSKQK
jgi:hypothetical protein